MTMWGKAAAPDARRALMTIAGLAIGHGLYAQCADNSNVGLYTTCFGSQSMSVSTGSASADAAFGAYTLSSNTSGTEDTAVGTWAILSNTTGSDNTAIGAYALLDNSAGSSNTAVGAWANYQGTTASGNTAIGYGSMAGTSTGAYNSASGYETLQENTTGSYNVAMGSSAMWANQTGSDNTALGINALANLLSGNANLALGIGAGVSYTGSESFNVLLASQGVAGESYVLRLGEVGVQTKAFVAGVHGVTSASGVPVYVDSSGQLGTSTSSRRFKEDIADMGAASDELLALRPVTFHYKAAYDDGQRVLQYGLIAEEVAAVDPGLVAFGDDGQPLTVRYPSVNAMLLGEAQKQHAALSSQAALLAQQAAEIAGQKREIAALAARLAKLEAAAAGGH